MKWIDERNYETVYFRGVVMERNELETLIRFAKSNGIMNWTFEEVLNEYKTVKIHHEEPKFDPKTLQPFDKVLVKDDYEIWQVEFFSHISQREPEGWCQCSGDRYYFCIPYNEETKHLVGTKEDCPEYYKWWEE